MHFSIFLGAGEMGEILFTGNLLSSDIHTSAAPDAEKVEEVTSRSSVFRGKDRPPSIIALFREGQPSCFLDFNNTRFRERRMAPPPAEAPSTPSSSRWRDWLMCLSLCAHFAGYELIRSGSVTLLTGYIGSEGLSYTITVGFPLSALALWTVHYCSRHYGVRQTLRLSHLLTIVIVALVAGACPRFTAEGPLSQAGIMGFYCFREIYVGIIATQNWSFVRVPYDLLIRFAGMVSVASVVGSFCVEFLVRFGGVRVLLLGGIAMQCIAWSLSEFSFSTEGAVDASAGDDVPGPKGSGTTKSFYENCANLIGSNKTLQLLFLEALVHQACSNLLNLMFYDGLRRTIDNDKGRAVLIGRFFAAVNFVSCVLQVLVMPRLMSPRNAPMLLLMVPLVVLLSTSLGFFHQSSLVSVTLGFGIMKVLEYSVMTSAMELIYMPMGHEVRYLGKELIRFFGHRLGKSGTSLLISAASAHLQPTLQTQTVWSGTLAAIWGGSMFLLSSHLETVNESEAAASLIRRRSRSRSLGKDPAADLATAPIATPASSHGAAPVFDEQQLAASDSDAKPAVGHEILSTDEDWTSLVGREESDTESLSGHSDDDGSENDDKSSCSSTSSSGMEPYVFVTVSSQPLGSLRRQCRDDEVKS